MFEQAQRVAPAAMAPERFPFDEFVRQAIEKQVKVMLGNEAGARLGDDLEAVHDMRVASRRLRAALDLFAPLLERRGRRRAARDLRRVTRVLGGAREWDVHHENLTAFRQDASGEYEPAAIEMLIERVDRKRARRRRKMIRKLRRLDIAGLGRRIRRLARRVDVGVGRLHVAGAAWEPLQPRIAAALGQVAELRQVERPEQLHAMRIAVKRLRYVLELLKRAFVEGHAELVARTRALQDVLGRHHDLVLLEALVEKTRGRLATHGRTALAAGLAAARARVHAERLRQYEEFVRETEGLSAASFGQQVSAALGLDDAVSVRGPAGATAGRGP